MKKFYNLQAFMKTNYNDSRIIVSRDFSPTFYTPGSSMNNITYQINGTRDYNMKTSILKSAGNSMKDFHIEKSRKNNKVITRIIRSPTPNKTITHTYINKVYIQLLFFPKNLFFQFKTKLKKNYYQS